MNNYQPASWELQFNAIRASGPGGQNVNKVATAVELRFDILASGLPDAVKSRLLVMRDRRINSDGVVVLKAQRYRSQEKNKEDALQRLTTLIDKASNPAKPRQATKPGRGARERRLREKKKQADKKATRAPVKL